MRNIVKYAGAPEDRSTTTVSPVKHSRDAAWSTKATDSHHRSPVRVASQDSRAPASCGMTTYSTSHTASSTPPTRQNQVSARRSPRPLPDLSGAGLPGTFVPVSPPVGRLSWSGGPRQLSVLRITEADLGPPQLLDPTGDRVSQHENGCPHGHLPTSRAASAALLPTL